MAGFFRLDYGDLKFFTMQPISALKTKEEKPAFLITK